MYPCEGPCFNPLTCAHTGKCSREEIRAAFELGKSIGIRFPHQTNTTTQSIFQMHYLIAPYSHTNPNITEWRMRLFCWVDWYLQKEGVMTASPLLKHLVREECPEVPGDWAYWKLYSETLMRLCDGCYVIMMDGWEESVGVCEEIILAKKFNKTIIYLELISNPLYGTAPPSIQPPIKELRFHYVRPE